MQAHIRSFNLYCVGLRWVNTQSRIDHLLIFMMTYYLNDYFSVMCGHVIELDTTFK